MRKPKRNKHVICLLQEREVRALMLGDVRPDCTSGTHAHISEAEAAELQLTDSIQFVQHHLVQNVARRKKGRSNKKSAPTLNHGEMLAYAGVYGRSATAHLNELDKQLRDSQGLPPEDFKEKAAAKVTLWPLVGDDRAIRVGPTADAKAIELAKDLAQQMHRERGYSVTSAR